MKQKTIMILIVIFVLVGAASLTFWNLQKRNLAASSEEPSLNAENAKMKTDMILALQWQDHQDEIILFLRPTDEKFCQNWQEMTASLEADGMGVSGEAPGAQATVACQDSGFEMKWPKQISKWPSDLKKTGEYFEIPSQMFVRSIEIQGPIGKMHISSYEFSMVRGQNFELTLMDQP